MILHDDLKLLHYLAHRAVESPHHELAARLRAFEVCLSVVNSRCALPLAAEWFLRNHTTSRPLEPDDARWSYRLEPDAISELSALVPRFVVLFAEHRHCNLVGNSSAAWNYCFLALLSEPPDEATQRRSLEQLFDDVASQTSAFELRPEMICRRARRRASDEAVLNVLFEHECPDSSQGHRMVRLEIDGDEAVTFWPALSDDNELNFVDVDVLAATAERLGLTSVSPFQLATFLAALSTCTANHKESWGGETGAWFFDEGNIPFVMKQLEQPE